LGSKNRAIGLPATSVTVAVSGSGPSTTSVETVVTVSPASLDIRPNPITGGKTMPAVNTPATRHQLSKRATGRTIRRDTIKTCFPCLRWLHCIPARCQEREAENLPDQGLVVIGGRSGLLMVLCEVQTSG
jgi:hypothetical protein